MDVTLKRAADLARAALEAANDIRIEPQVSISIHTADTAAAAERARRAFDEGLSRFEALVTAHYVIRALIGAANARTGLDDLLTRRARLDALDRKLAGLAEKARADRDAAGELAIAEAHAASLRQRLAAGHDVFGGEHVSLSVVDAARAERLAARRATIRRERSELADAVAGINLSTRVALDAATVATLREARIVD
jgi:hypothetical protein